MKQPVGVDGTGQDEVVLRRLPKPDPPVIGLIADEQFIGTVIYSDRGTALPVAAAFAMVPILVMTAYLWGAKRLGAFESL